jgi:S1-C subfamily serine protease
MGRAFKGWLVMASALMFACALVEVRAEPPRQKKTDAGSKQTEAKDDAPSAFLGAYIQEDLDRGNIIVKELYTGGPAAKAGMEVGDRILKVADKNIQKRADVPAELAAKKPGETIWVTIMRGDKEIKLKVTLGKWPTLRPADRH